MSRWLVTGKVATVVALLFLSQSVQHTRNLPIMSHAIVAPVAPRAGVGSEIHPEIWPVETTAAGTTYSNGLTVRLDYTTHSASRHYFVYSAATRKVASQGSKPIGIVFHTTESLLFPMEPGWNQALAHTREEVLEHIQRNRSYNFFIDRFGQVYRVVPEQESANHAGHSVWADGDAVFVNLNQSFIGIAFEAQTKTNEQPANYIATPAQIYSGRLLTDMLRNRYQISEQNCVTHAQVSVNPDNMRLGYHTDWASHFPFQEMGLHSGYRLPVQAVTMFGFAYDQHFLESIGGTPWEGLTDAEEQMIREAARLGITPDLYRASLQQHFHHLRRQHNEQSE